MMALGMSQVFRDELVGQSERKLTLLRGLSERVPLREPLNENYLAS